MRNILYFVRHLDTETFSEAVYDGFGGKSTTNTAVFLKERQTDIMPE
jgi:hypothetical protein